MRFAKQNPVGVKTTTTHEGGVSFNLTPEQELVKMALTSFVDKTFYEDIKKVFERITSYTDKVSADFLLKLAIRGRKDGLRTINQILTVEALKSKYFQNGLSMFCQRPDDLIEIVGYYAIKNNQSFDNLKLANKLKKGIASALQKFDLYQLCKYKNKGDGVNIYDLINLTHPKVSKDSDIDKFIRGDISKEQKDKNITREKKISETGNKEESRDELMDNNKLDALATIRNLANMKRAGVSSGKIIKYLQGISRRKVFPFQALQAIDIMVSEGLVKDTHSLVQQVVDKLKESFKNITQHYEGKIAIGVDCSGSMDSRINNMSSLGRRDVAKYYGLLLQEAHDNADVFARADYCSIGFQKGTISVNDNIRRSVGGGTSIESLFNKVKNNGYDYLIVITDEQTHDRYIPTASTIVTKGIVIRNIADYANTIVNNYDKGYTYFTGLDDRLRKLSKDLNNLQDVVDEINKIDLTTAYKEGK